MSVSTRSKVFCLFSAAVLAALFTSTSAYAQAVYGSIFGTVTDASGALVPGATVTVEDVAKGTSSTLTSNASGEFAADHLIPDVYNVRVTAQGFQSFQQTGITVLADTSTKVQIVMQVGASETTVEVNADTVPQLKTDRADVSTSFVSREIQDLPVAGRNFTGLQLLLPGAQELGWSHAASENPQGSKQIMVDGQAFAGTAYELDGTDNQDPILGIIVVNPNFDSLSETKIATQNFDAEFGKAVSAVVTAQTKSGSNNFHGSAFDFRQSAANLARDPFTQGPTQGQIPQALKNQFGGSIGGPILKDKLFFFGDYQGTRQKVGTSNTQTVPSSRLVETCLGKQATVTGALGCDFSEYAANVTPAGSGIIYQANGTPYPGNVIPASQVSTQAKNLLTLLEPYKPNNPGTFNGLKNNYSGGGTGGLNSDQWDVRGDYQMNDKVHFFTRFSRFTDTLTGKVMFGDAGGAGFGLGGYGGTSQGANDSLAIGMDYALNAKLVTDLRFGYFRYNIITSKYDQNVQLANQLGIPGMNTSDPITGGAPSFQLAEVGASTGAEPSNGQNQGPQYGAGLNVDRCNCPLKQKEDQFQIVNNWTKIFGNHSLKVGADLRYARNLRVPSDNDRTGILYFSNQPTSNGATGGLGFATFVLGQVTGFKRYVSTSTNAKEFQKRDFFYAQDTWRATQKLTVNYGLRYEFYFPETINAATNGALLDPDTGYLNVAGVGQVASNMNWGRDTKTWSPRVGVAYQITPNTVIRGGYGRSFDIGVFGSIFGHAATQNLPILQNQQQDATGSYLNASFTLAQGPPAPTPIAVPSNGFLPNPGYAVNSRARPNPLRLPSLDAWNVALQQSLSPTLSLTVAYAGNKGTHTLGDGSANTTNPNETAVFLPAQYSITGQPLHYEPATNVNPATNYGVKALNGQPLPGVSPSGGTSITNYLTRYYAGKLPACADPAYHITPANPLLGAGQCGWTNGITDYSNNFDSHFNALQVTLAKQFTHGFSMNGNYAWQRATSWASGYSTWSKPAVKGRDGFVREQQIIVYGLYELPFGKNKPFASNVSGVVNQFIGGWQLSPVLTYSSGLPFSLSYGTCGDVIPGGVPCQVNGNPHAFHSHITGSPGHNLQFFSKTDYPLTGSGALFTKPGLDQIGTVGRNSVYGPHLFNTDLAVQKNFSVREKATIMFRTDFYNVFNKINWGTPSGNLEADGSITNGPFPDGSSHPRQLQFSLQVRF
jgi:outer membrane receptor protein involved in Fe transport